MSTSFTLLIALIGGLVPALLWLWFWIREDRKCPEPKGLIGLTFVAGMLAVPLVIPLQKAAVMFFSGTMLIVLWAAAEELLKVGAAYVAALRRKEMNEPIDAVMYLITAALGFAALENALFLFSSAGDGFLVESILTGNLRFIGATLLHTLTSATVGIALALVFYKPKQVRRIAMGAGIILAIALHTLFNFFILHSNSLTFLTSFLFVWIGIIIIILMLERIKQIRNPRSLVSTRNHAQRKTIFF